jgi:Ulp1 family protease
VILQSTAGTTSESNSPHSEVRLQHQTALRTALAISDSDQQCIHIMLIQRQSHSTIIAQFEQQQVSYHSLQTTVPHTWLNDEVINFYLALLNHDDRLHKEGTQQL